MKGCGTGEHDTQVGISLACRLKAGGGTQLEKVQSGAIYSGDQGSSPACLA